ncbi:MAG: AMIN domain-containing protein, partial [Pseudomonadota bacterium]|nr:AMIN domain-containing protein [Pseudomonadota bacterium]
MRRRQVLGLLPVVLAPALLSPAARAAAKLQEIRLWHAPDHTRLVFDLSAHVSYKVFALANPERLVIDLQNADYRGKLPPKSKSGPHIKKFRGGKPKPDIVRFVLDLEHPVRHTVDLLQPVAGRPYRLVLDISPRGRSVAPPQPKPATGGDLIIVLDPGHGGEDPGALGKRTREKDV